MGLSPGAQASTHRYREVDTRRIKGHGGRVETRRLHGDRPGKQEKDDEGGGHKAGEHCQEHEELPVGREDKGKGSGEVRTPRKLEQRAVQTLLSIDKALPCANPLTPVNLPLTQMWRTSPGSDVARSESEQRIGRQVA